MFGYAPLRLLRVRQARRLCALPGSRLGPLSGAGFGLPGATPNLLPRRITPDESPYSTFKLLT
jgi:hypothetical protein